MHTLTYSGFREHLKEAMQDVCDNHKELLVTTRGNKNNVVVMSQEDFEGIQETLYLLSSPKNAEKLMESIHQYNSGQAEEKELQE